MTVSRLGFLFTALLLFDTWYRYARAQTSCQRSSIPILSPQSCKDPIGCGDDRFIVIHNITYEEQKCTGSPGGICCCAPAEAPNDGQGKDADRDDKVCMVDYEDFQDSYFKELAKDCIGMKRCQVENRGMFEQPTCALSIKPMTQKISYSCIREPVHLCSTRTIQRESGAVYLYYNRTFTDRLAVDSCYCTVRSPNGLNVSWVFGSYQNDCSNTQLKLSAGAKYGIWGCIDEAPEESEIEDFNGLHFPKMSEKQLNISLHRLYKDIPTNAPERIWIAVEAGGNVYIECNMGDGQGRGSVTEKVTGPDSIDSGGGDGKTTLVVAVACVSALVILALLLAFCLIWRRRTSQKMSQQNVGYTHYDTRNGDSDYSAISRQGSTAISRQGSTYATINDLHIDTGDYSRISVKSNEYNKANLNDNEIILDPNYSRLQSKNSYSRIKETANKAAIDSTDYNHTLSTSSVDDYNRTTDKGAGSKASFQDYHHIGVKSNSTGDTLNGNTDGSEGNTGEYNSANHTYNILEKGSAGNEVARTGTDINARNNVTVIAVNKDNQQISSLPFKEKINDGYETTVLSPNKDDISSTEMTKTSANGYETAKPFNSQVLLPTKTVATDNISDRHATALVTNNEIKLPTQAITGRTTDGYETAVVSHNTNELPMKVDRDTKVDGYETAVLSKNIVELQSTTEPVTKTDGYETALVTNNNVELPKKVVDGTKRDDYETALVTSTVIQLPTKAETGTKSDGYETAVVTNVELPKKVVADTEHDSYETALVPNTKVHLPTKADKDIKGDGYETAVVTHI